MKIILQSLDLIRGTKFRAPFVPLPPLIFSYLLALIHGFLWWWASSWLILLEVASPIIFLLHSTAIDLQEVKDSIDEEDPRPTSSTWSFISTLAINCLPWLPRVAFLLYINCHVVRFYWKLKLIRYTKLTFNKCVTRDDQRIIKASYITVNVGK